MTEAELVEAANSSWALVTSALGLYVTVISAYLIAAYLAGVKLTKSQAGIISTLYVGLQLTLLAGIYAWTLRGTHYSLELMTLDSRASTFSIGNLPIIMTVVLTAGLLASLKFMWDVRALKTE
jgi:hypothetical protein